MIYHGFWLFVVLIHAKGLVLPHIATSYRRTSFSQGWEGTKYGKHSGVTVLKGDTYQRDKPYKVK